MSINLGFKSDTYSLDKFENPENKIVINTYNNSNAILINTDIDSHNDAVINFKNKFSTGVSSNTYNIYDTHNNKNICSFSSNFDCHVNIKIKDLIETTSNTIILTSNLVLNLKDTNDKFNIYKNNISVFETTADFTTINNLKVQNTLYTNKISNYAGERIQILNPTLVGLVLESFNTEQSMTINNVFSKYYTTPTLLINRYDNLKNIVEIGTCNILSNTINKHFIVNRHGMVGIGSLNPDASLSITTNIENNPYIFKYTGSNIGDNVVISKYGNIGIGTNTPKALFHINRQDDLTEEFIRKDPLIKLDIQYDNLKNIVSTSNVYNYINSDNFVYLLKKQIDLEVSNEIITSNINHNVYFINNDTYAYFDNIIFDTCNIKLSTNNISVTNINNDIYNVSNIYYYPPSLYTYEKLSDFSYRYVDDITYEIHNIRDTLQNINYTSNTSNFIRSHYFNHKLIMMSRDTYNTNGYIDNRANPRYNADTFKECHGYYSNLQDLILTVKNISEFSSSNYINNMYYDINMSIENVNNVFTYTMPISEQTYEPPFFIEMTSNNDFKASLSSSGTLSLGTLDKNNKYLLHADGVCMIKRVELQDVYTSNNNINFNNINISNINKIYASSNIIDQSYLDIANISNAYIYKQDCSNLFASNLTINNVSSEYIKMNPANIHITTKLSLGKDNTSIDTNANSIVKISVNDKLTSDNIYFDNLKGMTVTNENNLNNIYRNPSICILGYDGSIPYINLSRRNKNNSLTDYFMRINNKTFNNNLQENSDIFEICCDTLDTQNKITYYNSTSSQPSFINHIKKFNLLTFGENHNICIQCTNNSSTQSTYTNGTNKISIGFPYGIVEKGMFTINDWPQYFNNVIGSQSITNRFAPYMLNVFGNVSIASIYGKSMMTMKVDSLNSTDLSAETVSIVVGSVGDTNTKMTINGGLYCTGDITSLSDSNIKRDIVVIDDALNKIKNISGYTYTNIQTSNRSTGLIAQEVIKILPEVVHKNNDENLLSISYANMMGIIVEGIKELDNKLEKINNRLVGVENDIVMIKKNIL